MANPGPMHRLARFGLLAFALSGCGKDSYLVEPDSLASPVEFGEGITVVTPADTVLRYFADFTPVTYQGRPAIRLQDLVGGDLIPHPDLHGYRFIGTDGFYPNMPGKGYGDNTWEQLALGYLDLADVRVLFQTELDPTLRKGHNVKYLIRVEVLRAIDIVWGDGRKLATVRELAPVTVPEGYPEAGAEGLTLSSLVRQVAPLDLEPEEFLYRVLSRQGTGLPRLLTWEEMNGAYYLLGSDRVVMAEWLGPAYQLAEPMTVRLEGGGR